MQACGAPPELLRAYRARLTDEARERGVEVFPENWHALRVFLAMGSQWRVAIDGEGWKHFLGLEYGSLPIVLAEHRTVEPRQPLHVLMPQLRTLEGAALEILNQA